MNTYEIILSRLTQISQDLEKINQMIKEKFETNNELD